MITGTRQLVHHFAAQIAPSTSHVSSTQIGLYSRPLRALTYCRPQMSRNMKRTSSVRQYQTQASAEGKGRFAYKIAAAFSGKGEKLDKEKHQYRYDSASGAHWSAGKSIEASEARARRAASGQDAYFVGAVGDSSAVAFGVADGVGGYADQGIDSAAFSHGLCNYMYGSAAGFPKDYERGRSSLSPLDLLQAGYNATCHDTSILGGGSTACVAVAEASGVLRVANLGDSGFVHLRLNAIQHLSEPQTHAFNTPFQLSHLSPKILAQIARFGPGTPFSDMPADSTVSEHMLRHGDIVVFATDGVWDNLSAEEVLRSVADAMVHSGAWTMGPNGIVTSQALPWLTDDGYPSSSDSKQKVTLQTRIATSLVAKAKAASLDRKRNGPFAKAVHKAYPREHWSGGKVDDICIVVALAVDCDKPAEGAPRARL